MEKENCTFPVSTNKVITFTSNKKNKKREEIPPSTGIDTVFDYILPEQSCLSDKEHMNDCHTYQKHIHIHSHAHAHSHTHTHTHSPKGEVYMSHPKQVQMINLLYLNYETILIDKASGTLHDDIDKILYTLLEDIKSKIHGYRRQDLKKFCNMNHSNIHKKKFTEEYISKNLVSPHDTVEMLVSNRLKCVYCKDPCFLIYKSRYDKKQWTLDRIDNDIGHSLTNVVVCCLECNIKRGTMNKERFEKGKQIRYVRKLQF